MSAMGRHMPEAITSAAAHSYSWARHHNGSCHPPPLSHVRIPLKRLLESANASARISALLRSNTTFLAARMGNSEQEAAFYFHEQGATAHALKRGQLENNAGVYWTKSDRGLSRDEMLAVYAAEFVRAMSLSDFIGTYSTPPEDRTDAFEAALVTRYCLPRAACSPVKPRVLEPRFADVYHYEPWSAALEGKTVLIIHPFEESIRSQYARRRQVWPDARMLPDFAELKTVKVPISAVGRHPHRDFLETLEVLQQAVEAAQPFDVALMGCGGYGLPLAAYIRGNLSRSAIYVGGGLQLMFGITGSRWLGRPDMKPLVNEFWVRPSASETPVNAIQFERASYF